MPQELKRFYGMKIVSKPILPFPPTWKKELRRGIGAPVNQPTQEATVECYHTALHFPTKSPKSHWNDFVGGGDPHSRAEPFLDREVHRYGVL